MSYSHISVILQSISSHLPVISESSHIQRMDIKQWNKQLLTCHFTVITQSFPSHITVILQSSHSNLRVISKENTVITVTSQSFQSQRMNSSNIQTIVNNNQSSRSHLTFISNSIPVISQSSQGILKVISKQRTSILYHKIHLNLQARYWRDKSEYNLSERWEMNKISEIKEMQVIAISISQDKGRV